MRPCTLLLPALLLAACGSDDPGSGGACGFDAVPFNEDAASTTLTKLVLDCEVGGDLVPALIATHPDGDAALDNITQSVKLCADLACSSAIATWSDDFGASGQEEFFGSPDTPPSAALLDTICTSGQWPVQVEIQDSTGRALSGTRCATVTDNR